MKASELIEELQNIIAAKGDQPVFFYGCGTHHPLEVGDMELNQLGVCCAACCDIPTRIEVKFSHGIIPEFTHDEAEGLFLG